MVFHPSHRPLEIATRFPQFHSPDDDDISPTNKKHKGTLLSSYRGGHFYWALTPSNREIDRPKQSLRQCQIVPPTIMTDQISTTKIASDQLSGAQQRAIGALLTTRTINEAALAALRFLAKAQSTAKFAKKAKSFANLAVLCAFARNAEPSMRRVRIRPVRELPSE